MRMWCVLSMCCAQLHVQHKPGVCVCARARVCVCVCVCVRVCVSLREAPLHTVLFLSSAAKPAYPVCIQNFNKCTATADSQNCSICSSLLRSSLPCC